MSPIAVLPLVSVMQITPCRSTRFNVYASSSESPSPLQVCEVSPLPWTQMLGASVCLVLHPGCCGLLPLRWRRIGRDFLQ